VGKTHIKPKTVYPFEYVKSFRDIKRILDRDKPVCLIYASHEPHAPHRSGKYEAEETTLPDNLYPGQYTKNNRADYWTDCEFEDDQVGSLLRIVAESGKEDNTLFIYTSDHGYSTMAKWTCYDEGLNVEMLMRWPGHIQQGSQNEALVSFVDITPTLIDIAGGNPPEDLDGKSLLPLMQGKTDNHHEYIYGIHTNQGIVNGRPYPIRSVRDTQHKYIRNLNHEEIPTNVANYDLNGNVRKTGDLASWKEAAKTDPAAQKRIDALINRPAEELYDIEADPGEIHNLADDEKYTGIKKRLSEELDRWMQQQGDTGMKAELLAKPKFREVDASFR
jgi:uncharacterized sulfatase